MASKKGKPKRKAPAKGKRKPAKKAASKGKKPRQKEAAHGTRARYVNYKCRCPKCKKANNDYHAKRERRDPDAKAKKAPKGPKLNAAERSMRDTLIVTRRAQNWPWAAVAAEAEVSESAAKDAYKKKIASMSSLMEQEAKKILEGLIQGLQFSIGDLEQLAVAAIEERNVSSAVQAKKAANEAREKLQSLLQTTGILPHDLGTFRMQFEFQVIIVKVVDLVHTFVGQIEAIDLPKDKRPQVLDATKELTMGLEQLDSGNGISTNGGSDGRSQGELAGAATGGSGDTPD